VEEIDFLSDPTAGEVRIGAPEPVAAAIIAPVIEQVSGQYPRMDFHVLAGDLSMPHRQLAERKLELVISRLLGPASDEQSVEVLFHDPFVVVAGKDNPLTRQRKLSLADLMEQRWTLQPGDSGFGSLVVDAFRAAGLALPHLTVATTSFDLRGILGQAAATASFPEGAAGRISRRRASGRDRDAEGSRVEPAGATVHRPRPYLHEAAQEDIAGEVLRDARPHHDRLLSAENRKLAIAHPFVSSPLCNSLQLCY
jgi:DNA-binding transcriptional LysR family regulator